MMKVSSDVENLIYGLKLSSVGLGAVTGADVVHEPTNMDLAMKLHYLIGVYFFSNSAVQGLTIFNFTESMSKWLEHYYNTCGRFRRSESGRPFIKCNDCGVRIIEAQCTITLDEWLEMKDYSLYKHLVSNQVIGPELFFSPLVLIQFTWFKCGGMSVGLNWAHVLGDAFSASNFINMWGQIMADNEPLNLPKSQIKTGNSKNQSLLTEDPLSMKRVDHVGDYWIAANNSKTETFSFKITATQLEELQSKILDQSQTNQISSFESILAVIWQCLAKIRHGSEPRIITVCRNDSHSRRNGKLGNNQIISVVKADFSVVESDPKELAALVVEQTMDEKSQIEEEVEKGQGLSDFIMYGSNLTFVNLQEADFYGLELKGQKPVFVNYMIDGVGNEGVILVLPWPKDVGEACCEGRTVTVILPKNEVLVLRAELKREWSIA